MQTAEQQTTTENREGLDSAAELKAADNLDFGHEDKSSSLEFKNEGEEQPDHRENIVELFGGQKEEWSSYGPTQDNIATRYTDGKFYFSTDTERQFPVEKSAGDIEKFSDENGDWVMCYEPGPDGSIALYVYSRVTEKESDDEIKNSEIDLQDIAHKEHQQEPVSVPDQIFQDTPPIDIMLDRSPLLIAVAETFSEEAPVEELFKIEIQEVPEIFYPKIEQANSVTEYRRVTPDVSFHSNNLEVKKLDNSAVRIEVTGHKAPAKDSQELLAKNITESAPESVTAQNFELPAGTKDLLFEPEHAKPEQKMQPLTTDKTEPASSPTRSAGQHLEAVAALRKLIDLRPALQKSVPEKKLDAPSKNTTKLQVGIPTVKITPNRTVRSAEQRQAVVHEHLLEALIEATATKQESNFDQKNTLAPSSLPKTTPSKNAVNLYNKPVRLTTAKNPEPGHPESSGPRDYNSPESNRIIISSSQTVKAQHRLKPDQKLKIFTEISKFFPEKGPEALLGPTPVISITPKQSIKADKPHIAQPSKITQIEKPTIKHDQDRPDTGPAMPTHAPIISTDGRQTTHQTIKKSSLPNAKLPINTHSEPQHPQQSPSARPTESQHDEVTAITPLKGSLSRTEAPFTDNAETEPTPSSPNPEREAVIIEEHNLNFQYAPSNLSKTPTNEISQSKTPTINRTAINPVAQALRPIPRRTSENQRSKPIIASQAADADQTQTISSAIDSLKLAA